VTFLHALLRKLHLRSLDRGDYMREGDRPVENLDAQASVDSAAGGSSGYPPGYVKDYDDGRPRH
jgi:hypothetical protein